MKNFLRRHPQISVRIPEGLSLSRTRGFTPESVAQFFEIYEPAMDTIQHNPARLRRNRQHYCTAQIHENVRIEWQASDIFSSIGRTGITCDSRHLYESNWTLHSSVTCISKKKHETRTDEWHTAWINPRVPSLRVDREREFFFQWFLHFIKHTKPTKEDPVILVLVGHYSHTRNLEVITLLERITLT